MKTEFVKATMATAVIAALVCGTIGSAEARRGGGGGIGGMPFHKTFGIGLAVGEPTGLSAELKLSNRTGLDFLLGIERLNHEDLYLHADYLVYLVDLASGGAVGVPLYLGFGAEVIEVNDNVYIGARVPFGLAIALKRAPVQFFLELAVSVLLVGEDIGDRTDIDGLIGFRVYF